ncbi:MAG: hypothetical protein KXJ53_09505 [Phenylobacterium sp.]|nr:hypothetical protein [Phenylobacterium sp.]
MGADCKRQISAEPSRMVTLPFNLLGFAFQQGVDWLESGFGTAAAALAQRHAEVAAELQAYEAGVAAGGARIGEWEDGVRLWEQDQLLALQMDDLEESLMDLRKAYVLAAYHHWERGARRWTRLGSHAKHLKLVAVTRELGYPIDARLTGLYDLVNTLKHNSGVWASKLASSWPAVLKGDPAARPGLDWYHLVELDDRDVHEVCSIVRASGPTADHLPARPDPP